MATSNGVGVAHDEFIGDITGVSGNGYKCTAYRINPALRDTFRWLNGIASNFEKYEFRTLELWYRPTCATTQTGTVMFGLDPNVQDDKPESKAEFYALAHHAKTVPWRPFRLPVPRNLISRELFCRSSGATAGSSVDLKTYDLGSFLVATEGFTGTVGELHLKYDVVLRHPQGAHDHASAAWTGVGNLYNELFSGMTNAYSISTPCCQLYNSLNPLLSTGEDSLKFSRPGYYFVSLMYSGSGITTTGDAWVVGARNTATISTNYCTINGGGTLCTGVLYIRVTDTHDSSADNVLHIELTAMATNGAAYVLVQEVSPP
jgi:hypothetical protein